MAQAMGSNPFSRSYSSPELQSFATSSSPRQQSHPFNERPQFDKDLPSLPSFDVPSFNPNFRLDDSFSIPDRIANRTALAPDHVTSVTSTTESDVDSQSTAKFAPRLRLAIPRSKTGHLSPEKHKSWLHGRLKSSRASLGSFGVEALDTDTQRPSTTAADFTPSSDGRRSLQLSTAVPRRGSLTASASDTLAGFARRRSWISRTPSLRSVPTSPATAVPAVKAETKLRNAKTPPMQTTPNNLAADTVVPDESNAKTPKAFSKAGSYFAKIRPGKTSASSSGTTTPSTASAPTSVVSKAGLENPDSDRSCASSAASLGGGGSQSIESRTSQSTCGDSNTTTPITDDSSSDVPAGMKDTLWSSFKTLDIEHKTFYSKPMAQKIGQIQSLLVPFLRSTASHPSVRGLVPEDVDRRAVILNKWWGAVLEMLSSNTQPPVPGVDRPILLEAATMLMMRPEWRQTTSYFLPLAERSPMELVRSRSYTNSSSTTSDSLESAMLAESAEHSVRTMFVANLVKQMAIVVDKMSLRHAPVSLVNFSGKTCAYAFFFAPGVADILVRLWGLTPELIRRAADEFGLPRRDTNESEDIVSFFPPKLAAFGWSSPRTMWNTIKQIPKMSVLVARIPWTGPWVGRWKGRDTDLFFIFCKYYHILAEQFMPPALPLTEKARAPAFVLVQTQVLSILDTTIHRQAAFNGNMQPSSMVDAAHGADASAMAMPLPPPNVMKGMSENRIVVLLKDLLHDTCEEHADARITFAETFSALMMAATRRTSMYNNSACLTLCDFLEEVLPIFNEFEESDGMEDLVDWDFWLDVCKKVIISMNTMSQVRMLSFLYTIWEAAAKDCRRKKALCNDWLLTEETFNMLFNNWCPMVRAYFHRLLCWRVCHDDGSSTEVDTDIMHLLATRLKSVWAHYLYLKETASANGRAGPSTAPMSPTLGKRFIIIRQEVTSPQPGLFMGFDSFARPTSTSSLVPPGGFFDSSVPKTDSKKRWSLLGKVLSFSAGAPGDGPGAESLPRNKSFDDSLSLARREVADNARFRHSIQTPPALPTRPSAQSIKSAGKPASISLESDAESRSSSPSPDDQAKFIFKFILGWQQQQQQQKSILSRERVLLTPRLPGPAQVRIGGGSRCSTPQMRNGRSTNSGASGSNGLRSASGGGSSGLVHSAKNSSLLISPVEEKMQDMTMADASLQDYETMSVSTSSKSASVSGSSDSTRTATPLSGTRHGDAKLEAIKPTGTWARNTAYTGQSLAEWSQVISECNSFVNRRQDEGISRVCDVEIPLLSVEGFRKIGG